MRANDLIAMHSRNQQNSLLLVGLIYGRLLGSVVEEGTSSPLTKFILCCQMRHIVDVLHWHCFLPPRQVFAIIGVSFEREAESQRDEKEEKYGEIDSGWHIIYGFICLLDSKLFSV